MSDGNISSILIELQRQSAESFKNLAEQQGKLTDSVQKLVIIDAERAQREKQQETVNNKQDEFNKRIGGKVEKMEPVVARADRGHKIWDSVFLKIVTVAVFAILAAAGVNWLE